MSKIAKKEAISICKSCKTWGKKGCIASDIEASEEEYVVLQACMEAEIESPKEKISLPHEQIKTEGRTKSVAGEGIESPLLQVKGVDSQKAANWFIRHPDYHITPLQLSEYCHISHTSAKTICLRWLKRGLIQQTLQNHYEYQQKITASDLETLTKMETIKIHDIRMKVPIGQGCRSLLTPSPATAEINSSGNGKNDNDDHLPINRATAEYYSDGSPKKKPEKIIKIMDFKGDPQAIVKITRYSKEIEITIACSKNPLDILSLENVMGFIQGAGYDLTGAYFYLVEVNVDIPGLQIEGSQSIKLTDYKNCIQRYYNKKGKLRKEFILKGNIPLEEVLAVMRGEQVLGTNILSASLEKTQKEFEKVKEHLLKSNDNYRKIINQKQAIYRESKLKAENEVLKRQLEDKAEKTTQIPMEQPIKEDATNKDDMQHLYG